MEIGPVANVRIMPTIRSKVTDLGLTDVYEIERSTRTGDETYSPSGSRAASGFEDDEEFVEPEEDELKGQPSGARKINYFV